MTILFLFLGLVILVAGAEMLVRGASSLALNLGLSPLVVGLTIVAFGTSAPELAVAIKAAIEGSGGLMIGNVAGSNVFNVAVILGIAAMISPLQVHLQVVRFDLPVMLAATAAFITLAVLGGGLSRFDGALLFCGLVVYTFVLFRMARREEKTPLAKSIDLPLVPSKPKKQMARHILLSLAGLVLLVVGAHFMVHNAVILATRLGVSEAVIGLTVVAAGTSLPELATSAVAAVRRQTDLAIGNIVGSNIFNLLSIGGLAPLVAPASLGGVGWLDLAFMAGTSLLLIPFLRTKFQLVRWEGAVFLASYLVFLILRWPTN